MRTEYTCIGAYIDIEGLSLVLFNLKDTKYTLQKAVIIPEMPTYDETLRRILELAAIKTGVDIQTIDILSNFSSSLKNTILYKNNSPYVLRVKTTVIKEQMEDMFLNLRNVIGQNRIHVETNEQPIVNALENLMKINVKELKDIYEGNTTLNQILYAILHSVSWLESQMIKHQMV
jgi:hypothetical protein